MIDPTLSPSAPLAPGAPAPVPAAGASPVAATPPSPIVSTAQPAPPVRPVVAAPAIMKPAVPVAKLVEIPNATSTWPFKAFVRWPDIWVGLNPDGTDALGLATCFGGWDDPQDDGSTASGTNTKRNRIEAVSFAMDGLDFSALSKEEHAALDGAPIPRLLTPRGHTAFGLPVEVTVDGFVRPFLVPAGNIDLGPGRGSMKPGAPAHIIDFTPFLARRFVKGMTPEIAELARSFEVKCKYRIVGAAPLLLWKFPDLKTQSLGVAA